MKKPLDRITEAYNSELGEAFAEKVRSRIHWICESATGEDVLDVGASQGITSILLGREGKNVLGIDLLEDSIAYANEKLNNEEAYTQENVVFKHANFMTENFGDNCYDSIILGEVLEHITEPERFIEKAISLLKPHGRIVVTVPFGINDYFDHKKTYYLIDLMKFKNENLQVSHIEFFGKWIGVIYEQNVPTDEQVQLNHTLVERLELEFYKIERDLLEETKAITTKYKEAKNKNLDTMSENKFLKDRVNELEDSEKRYTTKQESLSDQLKNIGKEKSAITEEYELLRIERDYIDEEKEQYLNRLQELEKENKQLQSENVKQSDTIREQNKNIEKYELEKEQFIKEIKKLEEKEHQSYAKLDEIHTNNKLLLADLNRLNEHLLYERKIHLERTKIQEQQIEREENEEILKLRVQLNRKKKTSQENQKAKEKLEVSNKDLFRKLNVAIKEKIQVNKTLLTSYEKEERLLGMYRNLNNKHKQVSVKLQNLEKKYNALSNSKLGGIQLSYWRKLGERRRKNK